MLLFSFAVLWWWWFLGHVGILCLVLPWHLTIETLATLSCVSPIWLELPLTGKEGGGEEEKQGREK